MVANPDEPTKRGRGRPKGTIKPLREDPERYEIVYFKVRENLFALKEPIKLARTLMQIHHAQINDPREFAAALAEDRLLRLHIKRSSKKRLYGIDDPTDKEWYNKSAANALAHNFNIKVRALEKKLRDVEPSNAEGATSDQRDAHWLALMTTTWWLAIGAYGATGDVRAAAKDLAAKAGESEYFDRMIAPLLNLRGELPAG
jgi:hypothetical protein